MPTFEELLNIICRLWQRLIDAERFYFQISLQDKHKKRSVIKILTFWANLLCMHLTCVKLPAVSLIFKCLDIFSTFNIIKKDGVQISCSLYYRLYPFDLDRSNRSPDRTASMQPPSLAEGDDPWRHGTSVTV